MRKVSTCCLSVRIFKVHRKNNHSQRSREESMGNRSTSNAGSSFHSERSEGVKNSGTNLSTNIILNHDFSGGLHSWHPNCCDGFVIPAMSNNPEVISAKPGSHYAVVANRKECWQGLEQDITSRVSPGCTYSLSACVGVAGPLEGFADVQATLKLEHRDSATSYLFIARTSVPKERWERLEGTFSLSTMPDRVVFYLEGPSPGVDLLLESVVVSCLNPSESDRLNEDVKNSRSSVTANIILNHDFSEGLHLWYPNCCNGYVVSAESGYHEGITAKSGSRSAVITNRNEYWQGLEQDITSRVSPGSSYAVSACVGVSGPLQGFAIVQATLKLEFRDSPTCYLFIARTSASKGRWEKLEGTFSLSTMPDRVVFYLEGPSPGVDLLIESVVVSSLSPIKCDSRSSECVSAGNKITWKPRFEDGLKHWSGRGCKILLHDTMGDRKILPMSGKFFAAATERTQSLNGIQQEITGRVQQKLPHEVTAVIRIFGDNISNADVKATLWVQTLDSREQYIGIANSQATDKDWVKLQGKFLLNGSQSRVMIYLEGPPPGTNIFLNSLVVKHAEKIPPSPLVIQNAAFGVNIITKQQF